jgi:hypothetical protein
MMPIFVRGLLLRCLPSFCACFLLYRALGNKKGQKEKCYVEIILWDKKLYFEKKTGTLKKP